MNSNFSPRPYRLLNNIQFYDWGGKNNSAFIPKLLGMEPQHDIPYAELWIGAHQNASSRLLIDNQQIPFNTLVEKFPREILGEYVSKKFSNNFPFLLKVLSAERMLSIQTHPNKKQAETLHQLDPVHYPDNNHKPEIAIAIDSLRAVAGFRPVNEIVDNLRLFPELMTFAGSEYYESILKTVNEDESKIAVKEIYSAMMKKSGDSSGLSKCINSITEKIRSINNRSKEEELILEQSKVYGNDIGLLSFFFFNLIELQPGQAIFTDSGIPHAYIKGNIIECMANSDNVIRAGLTSKFKDVDALLNVINYDFRSYPVIQFDDDRDEMTYKTTAEEFEVSSVKMNDAFHMECYTKDRPGVYLVMKGSMELTWNSDDGTSSSKFEKGESFLIPAFLKEFSIHSDSAVEYFIVRVP